MVKYVKFCSSCNKTGLNASKFFDDEKVIEFYKGYLFLNVLDEEQSNICPCCRNECLVDSVLTDEEFTIIQNGTQNREVLDAMVELKKKDIIEFEQKLNQFKLQQNQTEAIKEQQREEDIPHCPHCNSTNIRTLSVLNRGVSIAIWGIFSKKINKSFECLNCKYTW